MEKKKINPKIKKWAYRILKIIWIIIGGIIALITFLLFIKINTFSGSGFSGIGGAIGLAVMFAAGLSAIFFYVIITLLFLLIKWIVKKVRKNGKKRNS